MKPSAERILLGLMLTPLSVPIVLVVSWVFRALSRPERAAFPIESLSDVLPVAMAGTAVFVFALLYAPPIYFLLERLRLTGLPSTLVAGALPSVGVYVLFGNHYDVAFAVGACGVAAAAIFWFVVISPV